MLLVTSNILVYLRNGGYIQLINIILSVSAITQDSIVIRYGQRTIAIQNHIIFYAQSTNTCIVLDFERVMVMAHHSSTHFKYDGGRISGKIRRHPSNI